MTLGRDKVICLPTQWKLSETAGIKVKNVKRYVSTMNCICPSKHVYLETL